MQSSEGEANFALIGRARGVPEPKRGARARVPAAEAPRSGGRESPARAAGSGTGASAEPPVQPRADLDDLLDAHLVLHRVAAPRHVAADLDELLLQLLAAPERDHWVLGAVRL